MSLDDALTWIFAHVPWYVAAFALLATVALSIAFNLPGWASTVFASVRGAALARLAPELKAEPAPPPSGESPTGDGMQYPDAEVEWEKSEPGPDTGGG